MGHVDYTRTSLSKTSSQQAISRLSSVIIATTTASWSGETGIMNPVPMMRSIATCKAMG